MSREPLPLMASVASIPPGGKHYRIEPTEDERAAIAAALGIVAVSALKAELYVRPAGAEAFSVRGALNATVVQTDVVTLDPVAQTVSEEIDLTLLPASDSPPRRRMEEAEAEIEVENADFYRGGHIDLGSIVVEHLALGLDPYPRSPGVEFPGHIEAAEAPSSPFAALAKLKKERD